MGHLRLLLISQSEASSSVQWPIRGGWFLLRGASNFLPSTDKTRCEKKQRCSLIYIHLPENTFIKEPHCWKRNVLLGCYPQTRHEVSLIFENIQKTFHEGFRQTSLLTVFSVNSLSEKLWSRLLFLLLFINWGDQRRRASKYFESVRECV